MNLAVPFVFSVAKNLKNIMKKIGNQLLLTFCIITFGAVSSHSATLKILPGTVTITSNQPFTMDITIEDVVDLYGIGLDIIFDTTTLKIVDVIEGDFLNHNGTKTSFQKHIDDQQGRVIIGITRLGSITGVSGSGTVATIILKPKSSGMSILKLQSVSLKDSQIDIITVSVIDSSVNIELSPVILEIIPTTTKIISNQTFTVTINAKDAVDLYGASFDFMFDSDKLRVIEVEEGDFLKQATISTSFLHKIDNEQGRVIIGISRLGQVSGVTGSGILVSIIMKAKSSGTTTLKLSNIKLQDSSLDISPWSATQTIINILPAILSIEPKIINVHTNQNFTVRVEIDKVAGLYGTSFDIVFDPSLLQGVDIIEGNFLNQNGLQTAFLRTIDNKNGRIIIGISRLEKVGGVDGSGILCSIIFKPKGAGTTTLSFDNLYLKDAVLDKINVETSKRMLNIIPIKLRFNPQTKEVKLDHEYDIDVFVEGVVDLFGAGFDITFDNELLEVLTIIEGSLLNQDGKSTHFVSKIEAGRIIVGISRLGVVSGVNGSGVLCKITFKGKKEGISSLSFDNIALRCSKLGLLAVETESGTISTIDLKAGPIKGNVTKADRVTPIKDAKIDLIELNNIIAVTTTCDNGEYEFNNLQAGDYEIKVSVPSYNIQLTRQITLKPFEVKTEINFILPKEIIVYPNPYRISERQRTIFFSTIFL